MGREGDLDGDGREDWGRERNGDRFRGEGGGERGERAAGMGIEHDTPILS